MRLISTCLIFLLSLKLICATVRSGAPKKVLKDNVISDSEDDYKIIDDPIVKYDSKEFRIKVPLKHHFVLFFTKWSSASKAIFPIWDELGEIIKSRKVSDEMPEIIIAKVDCSVSVEVCEWQDIAEYPTIKLYRNSGDQPPGQEHKGMRIFKYSGVKDLYSLEQFLNSHITRGAEFVYGARVDRVPEPINGLNILREENFDDQTQEATNSIICYCTDWSSKCKKLEKTWEAIAKEFKFEDSFLVGIVDCTTQRSLCRVNGVKYFPEVHWYKNHGDYDETFPDKEMELNVDNLKKWVLDKLGKKEPRVKKTMELYDKEDLESMHTSAIRLDKDTFHDGIKETNPVLVYFHTPWCSKCPDFEGIYEDLGEIFNPNSKDKDEPDVPNPQGLVIARVDCALNKDLCTELKIDDMPMIIVYKNGKRSKVYDGPLSSDGLNDFAFKISGADVSDQSDTWGTGSSEL